jgi:hypothetical protein
MDQTVRSVVELVHDQAQKAKSSESLAAEGLSTRVHSFMAVDAETVAIAMEIVSSNGVHASDLWRTTGVVNVCGLPLESIVIAMDAIMAEYNNMHPGAACTRKKQRLHVGITTLSTAVHPTPPLSAVVGDDGEEGADEEEEEADVDLADQTTEEVCDVEEGADIERCCTVQGAGLWPLP